MVVLRTRSGQEPETHRRRIRELRPVKLPPFFPRRSVLRQLLHDPRGSPRSSRPVSVESSVVRAHPQRHRVLDSSVVERPMRRPVDRRRSSAPMSGWPCSRRTGTDRRSWASAAAFAGSFVLVRLHACRVLSSGHHSILSRRLSDPGPQDAWTSSNRMGATRSWSCGMTNVALRLKFEDVGIRFHWHEVDSCTRRSSWSWRTVRGRSGRWATPSLDGPGQRLQPFLAPGG